MLSCGQCSYGTWASRFPVSRDLIFQVPCWILIWGVTYIIFVFSWREWNFPTYKKIFGWGIGIYMDFVFKKRVEYVPNQLSLKRPRGTGFEGSRCPSQLGMPYKVGPTSWSLWMARDIFFHLFLNGRFHKGPVKVMPLLPTEPKEPKASTHQPTIGWYRWPLKGASSCAFLHHEVGSCS